MSCRFCGRGVDYDGLVDTWKQSMHQWIKFWYKLWFPWVDLP